MYLRHVADHLSPLSRATFRTAAPYLMESVAPSPRVEAVACLELEQYLVQWRDRITHLSILIDQQDQIRIVHVLPALSKLVSLDIRTPCGDLSLWCLQYMPALESITVVANSIRLPECQYPNLKALRLVGVSSITMEFESDMFPVLDTLHLETHIIRHTRSNLSPSIQSLRLSAHVFPVSILSDVCLLPRIRHLSFEGCRLTYLPEAIGKLETLETLSLRGNFLTIYNDFGERDGYMLPIRDLHSLRSLDISDNVCMQLGSPSIDLPPSLEVLDVRSSTEAYYEEPFFNTSSLHGVETMYTSRLPSREDIQSSLQNLKTLVYAPPVAVRSPFQSMVELCTAAFPSLDRETGCCGVEIPSSIDGVHIYMDGPMHLTDVMTYSDL